MYVEIYNHVGRAGLDAQRPQLGGSAAWVCVWTLIPSLLLRDGTASLVGEGTRCGRKFKKEKRKRKDSI